MQTQWVTCGACRIRLVTTGETGPWLVLWHGLGGVAESMHRVLAEGPARGYRVAALDSPGHGESEEWAGEWTAREVALVWTAILDHLGAATAFIGGHSYGGTCTMAALPALAARVRGVVLLDAGYMDFVEPEQLPAFREQHARQLESQTYPSWAAYLDAERAEVRHFDEVAARASVREVDGKIVPAVSLEASVRGMGIFAHYWIADLPRLETPALLVMATEPVGWQDRREEGAARLQEKLPNMTVQRLADTRHDLFGDNPEQTLAAIWSFLNGVPG